MKRTVAAATVGIMAVASVPQTFHQKPREEPSSSTAQSIRLPDVTEAVEALEDQADKVAMRAEEEWAYREAKAEAKEAQKRALEARRKDQVTKEARKAPKGPQKAVQTPSQASYPNNLDGWIREALSIMAKHGIPGSYEGIHRNIMRESGGNPTICNQWDSNAAAGTPSCGLLQVIQPTFDAYHVPGTAHSVFDPVANIVAACNYAARRYGSIDNVYGAY